MKALGQLLHNRNYVLYWFGSMFSVFGIIILQFIISLYVYDLTGNPMLFGALLFIAIVPRLILYPLAGLWADRYSRRRQMLFSVVFASVMLAGFTGVQFFITPLAMPALFALVMLLEVFDIVFMSANMSVPPMIVPSEQLGAANSAGVLYSDFGYVIGVVFAAMMYAALGFGWSLVAVCGCLILSFFFILPLRLELPKLQANTAALSLSPEGANKKIAVDEVEQLVIDTEALRRNGGEIDKKDGSADTSSPAVKGNTPRGFFSELLLGARIVANDRLLLVLFTISIVFNFFCIPIWDIVLLFFVRGDLGVGNVGYGIYTGVQAVGDFLVAFVFAALYTDHRALKLIRVFPAVVIAGFVIMLIAGAIVGISPLSPILIISALGSGFIAMAVTAFVICKNTIVQKRVPGENLSRVFSINRMTALIVFPFANLLFGFLVEYLGYMGTVTISMLGMGVLLMITLSLKHSHLKRGDVIR